MGLQIIRFREFSNFVGGVGTQKYMVPVNIKYVYGAHSTYEILPTQQLCWKFQCRESDELARSQEGNQQLWVKSSNSKERNLKVKVNCSDSLIS